MRALLLSILTFLSFTLNAQSQSNTYEYVGVIKLNDTSFISYKLAFEELDGLINGFSIADLGGKHETKSDIRGTYNEDEKKFDFSEYNIVYTKSPITELDMCLVNFSGKLKNLKKNKAFSGTFKGIYPDGNPCIDGDIIMSNARNVEERIAKMDKKIQKSKKISQEIKDKISAKRILDTLTMSVVRKDENLNIFTSPGTLVVSLYDFGRVDNDRINLYLGDDLILEDYAISKEKKEISIQIDMESTVLRVVAISEGTSPPNTVKIEIKGADQFITTSTSLRKGDQAELTFIKQ